MIVVTRDFPPENGGIQRYCASLACALVDEGARVTVVTSASDPRAAAYDAALPYRVVRCGGDVVALRAALDRSVAECGPCDVVAASWKPAGAAAALVRLTRDVRLTIVAHGSEIARQTGAARSFALRTVLARADRIVAVSSFTARLVTETSGRRADVVPNGVAPFDVVRAPSAIPSVVSVGRLIPRKGFDRLLPAFARVANEREALLEIVGDGPQRAELEALAARLGIRERVRFLGAIDDPALYDAYARAWCFAMPNRREGYDVEGFGLVFLEAAVAGLPSIGGRGSGAEDAIDDGATGFLVDGNDVDAIAGALRRLLGEREATFAMGAAARRRALVDFSWSRVAAAFLRPHQTAERSASA
jgi:phosphatidylinositol alpha-1,6-mannosyltransferase